MFGICIESSHERGMGHLFRQLNFAALLAEKKERFIFFVNDNPAALKILAERRIPYNVVSLDDFGSGWEKKAVMKHKITTWIDDRLNTDERHARFIKDSGITLVVFDDYGSGAALADFNFTALFMGKSDTPAAGKKVFSGAKYLVLSKEIDTFKRLRTSMKKVLVTLGGSDTHGVTVKVVELLKSIGQPATIILGPSFEHRRQLDEVVDDHFKIKLSVPSLVEEMRAYDLAICGGGMTPFEANASGLPCVIIANERFEIPNAQYLDRLGSSVFAGYHEEISRKVLSSMPTLDLTTMSQNGLSRLDTKGAERIWAVLPHA